MSLATATIKTLAIQKSGDTGTMSLTLRGDGSYAFLDKDGLTVTVHSVEEMRKLFEALDANL